MAGKVRGIDCKLFVLKAAATGAGILTATGGANSQFSADPATDAAPDAAQFDEVKTVNNVEQSLQSTTYAYETRESADDIVIPTGRTRDLTISIYEDASDPLYLMFWKASRATVAANKILGLAYANTDLGSTPIIGTAGNFSISQEDWSEPKKEGKLVKFKLSVADHVVDFVDTGA